MKHVVVDPVTRIEGHLRVEVQVDEATGKVSDAVSSGTAWRGLELIMNDRDPRDAWAYIQRICGVCTTAHALGALRAVEDALGIKIPKNANYIRNIMASSLTVQDHVIHFYHLHSAWIHCQVCILDNIILYHKKRHYFNSSAFIFAIYFTIPRRMVIFLNNYIIN